MGHKKNNFFKEKEIPLIQQIFTLRSAYPDGKIFAESRKKLVWFGKILPTPLSQEYKVLLTWEPGFPPRVWVMGDELQKLDDPDFPHKFEICREDKMVRLCLYRYQEFNSCKLIFKTIIPWTVEWLYHYEIWLATGEWCGGGEHPEVGNLKAEDTA